MSRKSKVSFQSRVLTELRLRRRLAYRDLLVLQLRMESSDRNPAHIHTIAKNVIDLLGRPLPEVSRRCGLLYRDDQQIHGLAVSCEHGVSAPSITVSARSLGEFREDLAIAERAISDGMTDGEIQFRKQSEYECELDDLLANRDWYISHLGDTNYQAMLVLAQRESQHQLLGASGITARDLYYFYRANDLRLTDRRNVLDEFSRTWEEIFIDHPLRIRLEELPVNPHSSDEYRNQVDAALREFRSRYSRLLTPLRVPVAIEVAIKPPLPSRSQALHDLDNVLRRYLIPKVVELFEPPSHFIWALERDRITRTGANLGSTWSERFRLLPKSTAIGLIRFEAWKIPRTNGDVSPGFVALAVTADMTGHFDSIARVDKAVDVWVDSLD